MSSIGTSEPIDKQIDVCYSPDDGGWYLQRFDAGHECEVSKQIYHSRQDAIDAYRLWRTGNPKSIHWQ